MVEIERDVVFVLLQSRRLIVYSLLVFEDFMYWSTAYLSTLSRCTKFSCANKTALSTPGKHMKNTFLYHPVVQLPCKKMSSLSDEFLITIADIVVFVV